MKLPIYFFLLCFTLCVQSCNAQNKRQDNTKEFEELLASGKNVFEQELPEKEEFGKAIKYLEKAVEIDPDNAEAHYFLGYAYSRYSSFDGKEINKKSAIYTLKAIEQFETVNRLTPKYTGEFLVLDPYSKLSSEWGALSMSYYANHNPDSALWACTEGRKRGAFSNYSLAMGRKALDMCKSSSFLIIWGDSNTFSLWYLQTAEKYRTDVKVIAFSLLETEWYPKMIEEKDNFSFGFPPTQRDTMDYISWKEKNIRIKTPSGKEFSWLAKTNQIETYNEDGYLYRCERLFLNLLEQNKFTSEFYFTYGFDPRSQINLNDNLQKFVIVDRINYNKEDRLSTEDYINICRSVLPAFKLVNRNSQMEVNEIDIIRYYILFRIYEDITNERINDAKKLMEFMDQEFSIKDYPPGKASDLDMYKDLKSRLNNN